MLPRRFSIEQIPSIAFEAEQFKTLFSASEFRETLLEQIRKADHRIYLIALYLEDDEAGREILSALYQAKQNKPELEIAVFVDWHRAQRGLIGADANSTNADMYQQFAETHSVNIPVYGVPVQNREVFGVLHLKGFVIDNTVIYSGASINNIYLNKQERYRFDRYHVIKNAELANSMVDYVTENFLNNTAVFNLANPSRPTTKENKLAIRQHRAILTKSQYRFEPSDKSELSITPIAGLGKKRNLLNQSIVKLLASAKDEIWICTPYFNFPRAISKEIRKALRRGVKVSIVVGDKTANDFYIPPSKPFKTIGGLPYLYERNLRQFTKNKEAYLASRQLSIRLWKHDNNSFHLKGIWVDKRFMLLTGNNLNPRAWKLDLENGLLIQDNEGKLVAQFDQERSQIEENTELICTYKQIEKPENYPAAVQRLIKRITRVRADRLLKQIL